MAKSTFWVISTTQDPLSGKWWTDDKGGCLFTSKQSAYITLDQYRLGEMYVVPLERDEDLAAITSLYSESNNNK